MKNIGIDTVWEQKVLSCLPPTYTGHFVKGSDRKLVVKPKASIAELVLEWVQGDRDTLYIVNLAVNRKHREKGLGTELLGIAKQVGRATRRSWLGVTCPLAEKQIAWLESKGFADTEMMYAEEELDLVDFAYNDFLHKLSNKVLYKLKIQDK